MLEKLLFISFALAFWIKATRNDGFLYFYCTFLVMLKKTTSYCLGYTQCNRPYLLEKFFTCIPCRLFRVGVCITVMIYYVYGFPGYQIYFYPFIMAGLGTSIYRLIGE